MAQQAQVPQAEPNGTNAKVTAVVSSIGIATAAWVLAMGILGAFVASPVSTTTGAGRYGDVMTGIFWAGCLGGLGLALRGPRTRGAMMAIAVAGLLLSLGALLTLGGYLAWGHDWDFASKGRKVVDVLLLLPAGISSAMLGFAALPAWGRARPRGGA